MEQESNLSEFIRLSKDELDEKKDLLDSELKKEILKFVEENILSKTTVKNTMLQGRVKGTSSLSEKIVRKRYADKYKNDHIRFIQELPDLIGLRIVCLLKEQEKEIFAFIKDQFSEKVDEKYYSLKEQARTKNLLVDHSDQPEYQQNEKPIYRISCKWVTETEEEIYLELQIKSLINMFWGEIEHMLFYKNYAYMVGSTFYQEIMGTIHETLVAVDAQLELMSKQLSIKSEEEQFLEAKQMFAKLMYNMFSKNYNKELIDFEVDLREIYDLMVQIEFKNIYSLTKAQTVINRLMANIYSNYKFTNEIFEFSDYKGAETILQDERKELGKILNELSKSNDLYWIAFIGLYSMFNSNRNFTEIIDALTNDLINFYQGFNDLLSTEDEFKPGRRLIKHGVEMGIVHAFSNYRKIDFFLTSAYQDKVLSEIIDYLEIVKDRFLNLTQEELMQHGEKSIIEVLKAAISLKSYSQVEKKLSINYLVELYNILENKEFSGVVFDIEKFKLKIEQKKEVKSEDIIELFVLDEK